jgi:hypothetical protein
MQGKDMDAKVVSKSNYVIPYILLLRQVGIDEYTANDGIIELSRDQLLSLIQKLLVSVPVDEIWYKTTYKDIDEAIGTGVVSSAKEHFVSNGYFEGRLPAKIVVDEDFYISQYPDVADGIADGEINSAQEHFESHGFAEGRLPFKI